MLENFETPLSKTPNTPNIPNKAMKTESWTALLVLGVFCF